MSSGSVGRPNSTPNRCCSCGIPVVQLVSWTDSNPGRRFERCKYYGSNSEDGLGCKYWRWIDQGNVVWQTNLCNELLTENRALKREISMLKEMLGAVEGEKAILAQQTTELKVKLRLGNGEKLGGVGFKMLIFMSVIVGGVIVRMLG